MSGTQSLFRPSNNIYVEKLNTGTFLSFLFSSSICIIKVDDSVHDPFYQQILWHFSSQYQGQAKFGHITRSEIDFGSKNVQFFIHQWQQSLGLEQVKSVPSGYYLFVENKIRAYHPGLIDFEEDQDNIIAGGIGGLFAWLFDSKKTAEFSIHVLHNNAAKRVINFFEEQIQTIPQQRTNTRKSGQQKTYSRQSQRQVEAESLSKAYRLLGVSSSISNMELKRKYKKLIKQWHPDQFLNQGQWYELASSMTTEINVAHSVITNAREQ